MLFIEYPNCTTCKKAKKFLVQHNVTVTTRHIVLEPLTKEELNEFIQKSNLPIKNWFNTSGKVYRSLQLKDKLHTMSDEEKIQLLAQDGMLVKRPILISDGIVILGFKEEQYLELLNQSI